MTQDNTMRNATIIGVSFILSLFIINAVVGPLYNVWAQSLQGKAELARAEYNRQISIQEANAKKEAAKSLAEAEVERAKGVAQANAIIADSLKDNPEYLSYLWVTGLEEGAEKGNKTIYMIPSQGNIPAPVFNVNK
jgi:regulator of protease activity HflC (stomatin/prohibitin superfamily)